jgi:hypothetical protein
MITMSVTQKDGFWVKVEQLLDVDRRAVQICFTRRQRQLRTIDVGVEQHYPPPERYGHRWRN